MNHRGGLAERLNRSLPFERDPGLGAAHVAAWSWRVCPGCGHTWLGFRDQCAACRSGWEVVGPDHRFTREELAGHSPRDIRLPTGAADDTTSDDTEEGCVVRGRPLVADEVALEADCASGATQEEIAERWGLTVAQLCSWCKHRRIPRPLKSGDSPQAHARRLAGQARRRRRLDAALLANAPALVRTAVAVQGAASAPQQGTAPPDASAAGDAGEEVPVPWVSVSIPAGAPVNLGRAGHDGADRLAAARDRIAADVQRLREELAERERDLQAMERAMDLVG